MRTFNVVLSAIVLSASAVVAHGDPFTYPVYPNILTPAPAQPLTAAATGDVIGTFVLSNAGGEDTVRMFDVSANTYSPWLLDNRTSVAGTTANFGHVNAGDTLVFEIQNNDLGPDSYYVLYQGGSPNPPMASDPAYSVDGDSHAYATSFAAGTIPGVGAFTYLGMEDLPAVASDFDYNDLDFRVDNVVIGTGVVQTQTPEPGSLLLLGTGLAGVGGAIRRRLVA